MNTKFEQVRHKPVFTDEELQAIRDQADRNDKYIFDKPVDITNEKNAVIATVMKTLYVRNKNKIKKPLSS